MNEEIRNTRISGLGSSDAERVLRISRTGKISEADNFRLAVMLGIEQPLEFSSPSTEMGHVIEDSVFEVVKQRYESAVSNPFYRSEELTKKFGFGVFNHIDFEVIDDSKLIWIENKAVIGSVFETIDKYKAQLSWHWMLLQEKAKELGKSPHLILSHYDTNGIDSIFEHSFEAERLKFVHFVPAGADKWLKHNAEQMLQGFDIISSCIHNFEYEKKQELTSDELDGEVSSLISEVGLVLQQIKIAEQKVENFKAQMIDMMRDKGIKSIKTDYFSMTYIEPSRRSTFDSKKFAQEHPEEYEKYLKISQVKESLKITLKN